MVDEQQEKDIQNLIKQYTDQTGAMNNPQFQGNTAQGLDAHTGIDNQGVVDQSVPVSPGTLGNMKGPDPVPVGNVCPQCEMVHPPIRSGEKCPNAKVKAMNEEGTEVVVDINKYLVSIRNILMTNIEKKKIQDINKLFQNITLEIAKFVEDYKE